MIRPALSSTRPPARPLRAATLLLLSALLSAPAAVGEGSSAVQPAEPLFSGLFVNGREHASGADIYRDQGEHWVALDDLAQWLDLSHRTVDEEIAIDTPLGTARLPATGARQFDGRVHLPLAAMAQLGVKASFDESRYALGLYAPWVGLAPRRAALAEERPRLPVDHYPSSASLAHWLNRFSSRFDTRGGDHRWETDAFGSAGEGVWGLQGEVQSATAQPALEQLYWQSVDRYLGLRLGTASSAPGDALATVDYSGLQLAWSSDHLFPHLNSARTAQRAMLGDGASVRADISGHGPRGGIAELRIDDTPVARVRIALDGRYRFRNVPSGGEGTRIEVALHEFSLALPAVRVVDHSIASRPRVVSTGEWVASAGFGRAGDGLDSLGEGIDTHHLNLRYGLHNRLTLELAQQRFDGAESRAATATVSLGARHAAALSLADQDGARLSSWQWWSRWENASLSARHRQGGGAGERTADTSAHLDWTLGDTLSLAASGHWRRTGGRVERDHAASLRWRPSADYGLTLRSDDGLASALANYRLHDAAQLQLSLSGEARSLGLNYQPTEQLSLAWQLANQRGAEGSYTAGFNLDYRPADSGDSLFKATVSGDRTQLGYALGWQTRLSPSTQLALHYRRALVDELSVAALDRDPAEEQVELSVESSLWTTGSGGRSTTRGGIVARVLGPDGQPLPGAQAQLRLRETGRKAAIGASGQQHLNALAPGDYTVELVDNGLPIELSSEQQATRVRVDAANTTRVEWQLEARYGIAGRVSEAGAPTAGATVSLRTEDGETQQLQSDRFGYFQFVDLPPGRYQLQQGAQRREVHVIDDFVFGADLDPQPRAAALSPADEALETVLAELQAIAATDTAALSPAAVAAPADDPLAALGSPTGAGLSGRLTLMQLPLAGAEVQLWRDGRQLRRFTTDNEGYFSARKLPAGTYQLRAGPLREAVAVRAEQTAAVTLTIGWDWLSKLAVIEPEEP